jgi:O-antigen/teichoic acid export membrane protein
MAEGLKKTLSHAGVYGLGTAMQNIVSIVMLPVYTHYLTPADYGVLELTQMILDLAGIVFGGRLAVGLYRYYFDEQTEEGQHRVMSTALMGNVAVNLVGTIVLALAARPASHALFDNDDHVTLIALFAFSLTTNAMSAIPMLYIRALQRPWLFISMSLLKLLLQVGLNILFVVVMEEGVMGVVASTLITGAVVGGSLSVWTLMRTGVRFSFPFLRKLSAFSFPVMLASIGAYFTTFGDRYFIQKFHGLEEVGIYALAYRFGFVLAKAIGGSLYRVWSTQQFLVYRQTGATEMFQRVFLLFSLLLLAGGAAMAIFAEEMLKLLTGEPFWRAYEFVPAIALAYVLKPLTQVCGFGIQMSEKTRDFLYASIVSVIVMGIGYIALIPPYGGMGAAIATLIGMSAELAYVNYRSNKTFDMKLPWGKFMGAVALATLAWALSLLAPGHIIESLLVKSAIFLVFLLAVFFSPIVGPKERGACYRLLRNFRQKGFKEFST